MEKRGKLSQLKMVAGVLFIWSFFMPSMAGAQINNLFGGQIVLVRRCTASFNQVVHLIPAKPDLPRALIYQPPLSQTYPFFKVQPFEHVLGTWFAFAPCLQFVSFPPFIIPDPVTPVAPFILMIGTSGGQLTDQESLGPPIEEGVGDDPTDDGDAGEDDPIQPIDDQTCGCACNAQGEAETRALLASAGIGINKAACRRDSNNVCADIQRSNCTNVRCLPRTAVNKLINLKLRSRCDINITGGTESGHATHGQCRAIVDLRLNSCLNNYIENNATNRRDVGYGIEYRLPDGRYVRESNHWHVIY